MGWRCWCWPAFSSSIPKPPRCSRWSLRPRQQTAALSRKRATAPTSLSRPIPYPFIIPADDLGESTLQIPLEKLDQELKLSLNYGSVTFVTDPSLTSDKYATFQFDNFPHSPVLRTTGGDGRTTLTFEMPENWQVAEDAPEAMLTVTIPADALTRLIISLETGDVRLAPMQLKTLTVALNNGSLRAENLTVTRDMLVELPAGECMIDHLSIAEHASIAATRCIRLHLDGDPADYTTDARTDNVVRIGSKNIR